MGHVSKFLEMLEILAKGCFVKGKGFFELPLKVK